VHWVTQFFTLYMSTGDSESAVRIDFGLMKKSLVSRLIHKYRINNEDRLHTQTYKHVTLTHILCAFIHIHTQLVSVPHILKNTNYVTVITVSHQNLSLHRRKFSVSCTKQVRVKTVNRINRQRLTRFSCL
jgi:hypothetical protein